MTNSEDFGLSVVGTGYLGAAHAVCLAELGYRVVGVDADAAKVARLAAGELPFFEPGLDALLRKNLDTGRLTFSTAVADAAREASVHFVCVGTPQTPDSGAADLRFVAAAIDALGACRLRPGALVVGKSTVPAGTAARLAARLAAASPGTELAWNPEFLREGFAVEDSLRPDRLVFGVAPNGRAESVLRAVYAPLLAAGVPLVVTDLATAELTKAAANAFLATKISFVNAMSEVCEAVGGDVTDLARALALDGRIGSRFLRPGVGFGGGCLPKDIRAFRSWARDAGVGEAVEFLAEVDSINVRARAGVVALVRRLLDRDPADCRIAVLGAAFKPNSDDVRDSPALDVADSLHRLGAEVSVYDPAATGNARRRFPNLIYLASAEAAVTEADLVLHLTEWPEFRELDPGALRKLVRRPVVVDGRHALDADRWRRAGWAYHAPGRPAAAAT